MRAVKGSWAALWVQWVLATIAGFAAVAALSWGVLTLFPPPPQTFNVPWLLWLLTGWAAIGAVVGTMQWVVLRQRVHQASRWVLASLVGFAFLTVGPTSGFSFIAIGVVFLGLYGGPPPLEALLLAIGQGGFAGAMLGATQWLFLERHVSRSGWWVLANIAGLFAFMGIHWATAPVVSSALGPAWAFLVVWGLWGPSVFGAITGGALVWLLRSPREGPDH